MGSSFFFSRWLFLVVAGPDETKNLAGEVLRLGSDPLSCCRVSKKSLQFVKAISRKRGPLNQTLFQAKRPARSAGHQLALWSVSREP